MPTIIVTTEVRGRGFTAKIAVYALVVDVELSFDFSGYLFAGVGHFLKLVKTSGKVGIDAMAFYPRATAPNLEREESIT